MPLPHIAIGAGANGTTVEVDGRSLPVLGWRLEQQPGDVPRLTVQLAAEGLAEVDGMVQLAASDFSAFADRLDPKELDRLALNRSVLEGIDVTKALLYIVGEMLEGKVPA